MELRQALKEQYHAGLAMLAECVEKCPEEMWLEGKHPRTFFRIVFHAAFFTQVGMGQNEAAFQRQPWPRRREGIHAGLWEDPAYLEPYELPEGAESYARNEMLDYIRFVDGLVDPTVDQLDLASDESGFSWSPNMSKLSQALQNLRHLSSSSSIETPRVRGRPASWGRLPPPARGAGCPVFSVSSGATATWNKRG